MKSAERQELKSVPRMAAPKERAAGAGARRASAGAGGGAAAASRTAKKTAAVVLEVLAGQRDTGSASVELGVSLSRYYVLEARGVEGLVKALEPRPKGKQKSLQVELREARAEVVQLQREVARSQSLLRVSQRGLGVKTPAQPERKGSKLGASSKTGKKKRRRRMVPRAAQVIARLRREPDNGKPQAAEPGASAMASQEADSCGPDAHPKA